MTEASSRRALRPKIEVDQWFAGEVAEDDRGFLATIAELENVCVKEWANALGISRHALHRMCERRFGLTPRELLWRYIAKIVRIERRRGTVWEEIATSVGFSDGSSLLHAISRRHARW